MPHTRLAAALLSLAFAAGVHAQSAPAAAKPKKAAPPAKTEAAPPAASAEQIKALEAADLGDYTCEFNERVKVSRHAKFDGYVNVEHKKASYLMRPVVSQTGAIRLEDLKGQMLMIQIATKSMLMDVKKGQRLADHCLREGDAARNAAAASAPAGSGLGIDPAKAAAPRN